ncbi:MAG: GAF domain-containing protein [Candidatus Marinimicrobia bacterium]|nr:GAF domain-containing protein [Candidatus Neomarinimicrobiota bacterium]
MNKEKYFTQVQQEICSLLEKNLCVNDARKRICEILRKIPGYDWVGFYIADNEKQILILDQFVGEQTEHVKIPFGKGICGQSAISSKSLVVKDVSKEDNYIACSYDVKSEIVIPIFKDGVFVAQLDIDSHNSGNFDNVDKEYLEKICDKISCLF